MLASCLVLALGIVACVAALRSRSDVVITIQPTLVYPPPHAPDLAELRQLLEPASGTLLLQRCGYGDTLGE